MNIIDKVIYTFKNVKVGKEFTRDEIVKMVVQKYSINESSIIPSDYCYNRYNLGVKFDKDTRLFEYKEREKYIYLGQNYNYNGNIFWKPKGEKYDLKIGEWNNNSFEIFYDKIIAIQEENYKKLPNSYVFYSNITKDQWIQLLENREIFREKDINLILAIYLSDNHATTCSDLAINEGKAKNSYNGQICGLSIRILKELDMEQIVSNRTINKYWPILFWGRRLEDKLFEWKVRPELCEAIEEVFGSEINEKNY